MRTKTVLGVVLAFGVSFSLLAGSGIGPAVFGESPGDAQSGRTLDDISEDASVDADGNGTGLSADVAGDNEPTIGLLLAGVLLVSLYVAGDGTVAVPSVVTILLGSSLIPLLPAQYVTLAYTVVVVGITVAVFAAYQRFVLQGGF